MEVSRSREPPLVNRDTNLLNETLTTPTAPSQFLVHLSKHPDTPTRELLHPYLSYETWLRKVFAKQHTGLDSLVGLVSIYDGHESSFKIRTIDHQAAINDKYIMPLGKCEQELEGDLAIAGSIARFHENFEAFTHGVLKDIDWSNIVVAGSAALLPLLSPRRNVPSTLSAAVEKSLEHYFQTIANASDIDIFMYGLDEQTAIRRIREIEATLRKNQRLLPGMGISLRTKNAITFVSPKWPYRHVQVILRLYQSITELITGFDIDCACVAFDGQQVYSSPRGIAAISTRTNTIDLTRRSPSYENRLFKYRKHNFEVFWDSLDRRKFDIAERRFGEMANSYELNPKRITGLARLVMFEMLLKRGHSRPYYIQRTLKKVDEVRDPAIMTGGSYDLSGYTNIETPYSALFTADRVCEYVKRHATEPFMFGTLDEVLHRKRSKKPQWNDRELSKTIKFIKENPGRQMIGSFYPLTADDW
ncbi:hypothetical protein OCU04_011391 [Sclerotinia nivalis]|nr:hypothetical protein OCU04_011391 [Sclerotinia nivalis]